MTNSIDNAPNFKPKLPSGEPLEHEKIEALEEIDPEGDDSQRENPLIFAPQKKSKKGEPSSVFAPLLTPWKQDLEEIKQIPSEQVDLSNVFPFFLAPKQVPQECENSLSSFPTPLKKSRGPADAGFAQALPLNSSVPPHGFEKYAKEVILTPPSAPPKLGEQGEQPKISAPKLPQADKFWEEFDLPIDPPPGPSLEQAEETEESPSLSPKDRQSALSSAQELMATAVRKRAEDPLQDAAPTIERVHLTGKPKAQKTEKSHLPQEQEGEEKRPPPLLIPIPNPFPPTVAAALTGVQAVSEPYLNQTTQALFQQLVGSIVYIQKAQPGVSRTEIVLNADSLRGSAFYGTTVILERYSTAPDSFNIQLAGSPQAVQLFTNHLTGLAAAFTAAYENKQVDFRIGRMETVLAAEWMSQGKKRAFSSKEEEEDDSDREE